uniref:Uncharacterized protein n=1 Tax=Arundo donax TaxID=35708 RepID=A0A0A9GUW0_ARUDO
MVGGCAYHVGKTYNLCKVYKSIRIASSSVLGNGYGVVPMIRLLYVGLLGYVNRVMIFLKMLAASR